MLEYCDVSTLGALGPFGKAEYRTLMKYDEGAWCPETFLLIKDGKVLLLTIEHWKSSIVEIQMPVPPLAVGPQHHIYGVDGQTYVPSSICGEKIPAVLATNQSCNFYVIPDWLLSTDEISSFENEASLVRSCMAWLWCYCCPPPGSPSFDGTATSGN